MLIRFSHPSWQVTVNDRKFSTPVLLPESLDKLKEITTYISGVLKRPVYADLPEKQFRSYYKKLLVDHIKTRDVNKVIISYTGRFLNFIDLCIIHLFGSGYQTEDIDISNPSTFLCVLGDVVLGPDGIPVKDHKYVFSPEVVQRKVRMHLISLYRPKYFF